MKLDSSRIPQPSSLSPHPYNRSTVAQFLLITTLLTIAGLITSITLGFLATPGHAAQHILTALITTLIGLFSQSMTMFFFIGSGKQIKEQVKGAPDEAAVVQKTKDFQSRVFPAPMYAITILMVTFITGGGVALGKTPWWLHLI